MQEWKITNIPSLVACGCGSTNGWLLLHGKSLIDDSVDVADLGSRGRGGECERREEDCDDGNVGVGVGVTLQPAFAFVNTITPSSPASTAGLKPGDRIIAFGDANWRNHEKLAKVAQIVGRSEGRRIEVVVAREQQGVLTLGLVPRRDWGGRGTLGCHLKEV